MSGNVAFTTCRVDEGYPLFRYTAVSCNTTLRNFQATTRQNRSARIYTQDRLPPEGSSPAPDPSATGNVTCCPHPPVYVCVFPVLRSGFQVHFVSLTPNQYLSPSVYKSIFYAI